MTNVKRHILIILILVLHISLPAVAVDTDMPKGPAVQEQGPVGTKDSVQFLTGARIRYDAARYFPNKMDFSAETTSAIELEIARYKKMTFLFLMNEQNIYGSKNNSWYT
ncbi:MAG TPA: hypothetical protein VF857_06370, partial [Spirochaetota bacterium]